MVIALIRSIDTCRVIPNYKLITVRVFNFCFCRTL